MSFAALHLLRPAGYWARGDMENRIKECQLDLMADRTSAATLKANQLRLPSSARRRNAVTST